MKLGKVQLKAIEDAIKKLDPESRYVDLNVESKSIKYANDFVLWETFSSYEGDEEVARAYIICWLCTLGGYLPQNIEIEKRYSIGRPKIGAELDILINNPDGIPYALIELKAPSEYGQDADKYIEGQLFNIAPHEPGCKVLSYATVEVNEAEVGIKTITIDYESIQAFDIWRNSRSSSNEIPANYGEPIHQHYEKDGAKELRVDVTLSELQRIRRRLHDVLWKGSTADNTIYSYIVKLLLSKIYDEKSTTSGSRYSFQIFYHGSKRELPEDTFKRINNLYKEAYNRYLNINQKSDQEQPYVEDLNNREFSDEQIAFVVELIQSIAFTKPNSHNADILGSFFEGITRDGFKQGKGLFFTHLNVVTFILKVLQIEELAASKILSATIFSDRLPYIIDPSCGSGTFLLTAMQLITSYVIRNKQRLAVNDDVKDFLETHFQQGNENLWAKEFLYGIDQSELLAMSAKVNMILRKDGNMHIYHTDGLASLSSYEAVRLKGQSHNDQSVYSKSVTNTFDVLVSNPPFSITLDPQTIRQLHSSFELADDRNSENLFLERWYQLLKPSGRLGVVLPESFFSTKENLDARLFLYAHFNIKAIVSLPRHAFEPHTPTRTSLLFAQKKTILEEQTWKNYIVSVEAEASDSYRSGCNAATITLKAWKKSFEIIENIRIGDFGTLQDILDFQKTSFHHFSTTSLLSKVYALKELIQNHDGELITAPAKKQILSFMKSLDKQGKLIIENFEKMNESISYFDLPLDPIDESMVLGDLNFAVERCLEELKRIDVRVYAFTQTVQKYNYGFHVLTAENIGYKRTKRAEYDRQNDLFKAFMAEEIDGKEIKKPIQNLNTSNDNWYIEISSSDDMEDALSLLADKKLWQ